MTIARIRVDVVRFERGMGLFRSTHASLELWPARETVEAGDA